MAASELNFPTLGDLWSAWIEQHCRVPDRHQRGAPFREYDFQFEVTCQIGRIRPGIVQDPEQPLLNQAFVWRRWQLIGPQKIGKGPWVAAHVCRAAVGPTEFDGWAVEGDQYRCEDSGCGCGWTYDYLPGEPKGRRHPSPLIQIAATSDDQVANIWRPLVTMIGLGPLKELLLPRGEFVRIVSDNGDIDMDRIDRVTSSAKSRLGAPTNEVFLDESGLFTTGNGLVDVAETMRRSAAGMGGRSGETTNMYDPAQNSYAQQTMESTSDDVYRYWRNPDGEGAPKRKDGSSLRWSVAAERRRILEYVYAGAAHINHDSIDAEADELTKKDPAQAERFFGNRPRRGGGAWLAIGAWRRAWAGGEGESPYWLPEPPKGTKVAGGFDGSENDDWTAIRLETQDGRIFTPRYGPDRRAAIWNPAEWDGRIPRGQVKLAWEEIVGRYDVERVYCDPGFNDETSWVTDIEDWAATWPDVTWVQWPTNQQTRMWPAIRRFEADLKNVAFEHDGCPLTKTAMGNVVKIPRGHDSYALGKESRTQKIDPAVTTILAHEAAADARADKKSAWNTPEELAPLAIGL